MSKHPIWTMRLPDDERERWTEVAENERLSLAMFIRRSVNDTITYLEEHGLMGAGGIFAGEPTVKRPHMKTQKPVKSGKGASKRALKPSQLEIEAEKKRSSPFKKEA